MPAAIKNLIEIIIAIIYFPFLFFVRDVPCRIVLFYHGIKEDDVGGFIKQIHYLSKKNYKAVKASEIKTACADSEKTIIGITFDDAFINVPDRAVPILQKYGLPATIFVPTGNLGNQPCWKMAEGNPDKNERVMTAEEIIQLDRDGFEICPHTVSHPRLTGLNDEQLLTELRDSKTALEKILGHEVICISYPYGDHNDRVCKAAGECGYRMGFTIEPEVVLERTDDFKIGRFSVSPKDSLIKFKLKVSGAYRAVKLLRALKHWR